MRKRNLLLIICLLISVMMSAEGITEQQALEKAQQFMQGKTFKQHKAARGMKRVARVPELKRLYVFNVEDDGGFVIVSGDDSTEPILGYSTKGYFDEENIPSNMRAWLEQMEREIEASQKVAAARSAGRAMAPKKVPVHAAVEPLIKTEWAQSDPYNRHLPKIDGEVPLAGCVATAAAQVMYYYQWPKAMTESVPGYTLTDYEGNEILKPNTKEALPPIQFQWDKMKLSYGWSEEDDDAVNAVADLMLYCGYASKMEYGIGGSGAATPDLAVGMCKYFDYNPNTVAYVLRDDYSVVEWDALVYNELANGRPVIYSGINGYGGHAFICDGYDGAGFYHFNWGWGGWLNDYFKLSAVDPDKADLMGYVTGNDCIIGLQPSSWLDYVNPMNDDTWEVDEIEGIVATAFDVSADNTYISVSFANYNEESCGFGYGIGELKGDGTVTPIDKSYASYVDSELESGWSWGPFSFNFTKYSLPNGTHRLVPISLKKGETEWKRCKTADVYFDMTVSGGNKTVVAHPIEKLVVNEFDIVRDGEEGSYPSLRLNITNEGDNIAKQLYVYQKIDDETDQFVGFVDIKIASGNTKDYRIYLDPWYSGLSPYSAGTYTFKLKDASDNLLAEKEVTIKQDLSVTAFEYDQWYVGKQMQVDVTVENNGGDFALPLYFFASTTDTKILRYMTGSAIEGGTSDVVSFFFTPYMVGTWNFWVATDEEGKNVIGKTEKKVVNVVKGDVNGDGETNIADAMAVVNYILKRPSTSFIKTAADVNGDGEINIADAMAVVSIILKKPATARPTEEIPQNPY